MTEELKTLKNFEWTIQKFEKINWKKREKIVFVNSLKAEAVKWVKNCCGECRTDNETCEGCKRFIEFFNLTEEDLQ